LFFEKSVREKSVREKCVMDVRLKRGILFFEKCERYVCVIAANISRNLNRI